jgi:hypothetical protein
MDTDNVKVIHRKLGKERAVGLAHTDRNLIEIDPRQKPKNLLDTYIHEFIHIRFPDWSENKVKKEAKALTKFLWDLKYRKIDE